MSTRATYQFGNSKDKFAAKTTIYIHHDGYQGGAAAYFYAALIAPSKGNFATQFIRANDGAEITKSHEIHGDTEYRYNVDGCGPDARIECYKRVDWDSEKWACVESSTVMDFVAAHTDYIEDFHPFKEVKGEYGNVSILNRVTAQLRLDAQYGPLGHLRVWSERGGMSHKAANWQGMIKQLRLLIEAFPELTTPEIEAFLATEAETA